MALGLTLSEMLKRMGIVRPNAIVIDKSASEFNVIIIMINDDPWYWANNVLGSQQMKCKLLLC